MNNSSRQTSSVIDAAEFINGNNDLFALSEPISRILEMTRQEEISVDILSDTIRRDPALAGRLLKIANSPLYGLKTRTANIHDAVMALGITTVKCLALSAAIFDPSRIPEKINVNLKKLYGSILTVAAMARKLAEISDCRSPEEAFVAGLLHKIGLLFFFQHFSQAYNKILEKARPSDDWLEEEKKVFGIDHTKAGALIARKWRLPEYVVSAVGNHLSFGFDESDQLDDIIRLAVALNLEYNPGFDSQFEGKITKIQVITRRLSIGIQDLYNVTTRSLMDTLEFARAVKIDIGRPEDILVRANQEIFNIYMAIQKLFKERRELTRNILSAERDKGINEAKQIAISTLSHYINNASMIIFGQSQVLRMMRQNNSSPEEIAGSLDKSLDTIDEAIRRMVAVLDEIAELNSLDDVEYFEQSKIIDIDDRINERLNKLDKLTPLRPVQ
jgi:HD-like signal output (HDOD) protein